VRVGRIARPRAHDPCVRGYDTADRLRQLLEGGRCRWATTVALFRPTMSRGLADLERTQYS
jgi:hypothetical protein